MADGDDALLAYRVKEASRCLDLLSERVGDDMELALLLPMILSMHFANTFSDIGRREFESTLNNMYDMYQMFKNMR